MTSGLACLPACSGGSRLLPSLWHALHCPAGQGGSAAGGGRGRGRPHAGQGICRGVVAVCWRLAAQWHAHWHACRPAFALPAPHLTALRLLCLTDPLTDCTPCLPPLCPAGLPVCGEHLQQMPWQCHHPGRGRCGGPAGKQPPAPAAAVCCCHARCSEGRQCMRGTLHAWEHSASPAPPRACPLASSLSSSAAASMLPLPLLPFAAAGQPGAARERVPAAV